MLPELDASTGAVILPYDRFTLSTNQLATVTTAQTAELVACARAEHVPVGDPLPSRAAAVYDSDPFFGPWTQSQARTFGFVQPMTDGDLRANQIAGAPAATPDKKKTGAPFAGLTDAESAKVDACKTPDDAVFTSVQMQDGPWVQEMHAIDDKAQAGTLPGMKPILSTLFSCYKEDGLKPSGSDQPWFPAGTNGRAINAQQIALALKVVACKDQTGFTQQMANIEAKQQAVVIAKYADELVKEEALVNDALTKANAVIEKYHLESANE
jgi:hypothetical protein